MFFKPAGLLLLAAVFLSFAGGQAQANSAWKQMRGYSACGGVDQNGNLQEPCSAERAKFESKAVGSCPRGSFFDLSTWSCYSCPSGYNRNAKKITGEKACDKAITPKTARAQLKGPKQCPSGSFLDLRNGGECWKCPTGYGRTSAAVNKWNACGRIGKKATNATFKGKSCPVAGSFTDPRNGGECWSCPTGYNRTAKAVTHAKACKKVLDFKPAHKAAALTCKAGQHFDFVDGGTCWSCPEGTKRTFKGVKTTKACKNNKMKWVVPNRQIYGLFGLGTGGDDILATFIFERTKIDAAVKELASLAGVTEASALTNAWKVIDNRPWESPILSALLLDTVMAAASKPVSQRTASEKNLLARIAQLVQWNRQFVAYQAKQAHETWVEASEASYNVALEKMGAAAVYSDSMVTPPDYNEVLVGAIQVGAGVAGPGGAVLVTTFVNSVNAALRPFNVAVRQAAAKAAQGAAKAAVAGTGSTTTMGAAAAAAPMMIAAAAAVIVTMEIDKFVKLAEAEGKIRQSINIANSTVNLGHLLQQEGGPDELAFHWGAVFGAETKPSANFKSRLAELNGEETTEDDEPKTRANSLDTSGNTMVTTPVTTPPATTTVTTSVTNTTSSSTQTIGSGSSTVTTESTTTTASTGASTALLSAIKNQKKKKPKGTMRFELSSVPGKCLTKKTGKSDLMTLGSCAAKKTLWLKPDLNIAAISFTDKYCIGIKESDPATAAKVIISDCDQGRKQKWMVHPDGMVQMLKTELCLTAKGKKPKSGSAVIIQPCKTNLKGQTWRPWVPTPP